MKNISKETRDEIKKYLAQDLDTLYSTLDLIRSSREKVLYLPGKEVERGLAIFNAFESSLRQKICVEWDYCAKRHEADLQDTITLIAAIADVVFTLSIGFPPALITTILFKKGLNSFCDCE